MLSIPEAVKKREELFQEVKALSKIIDTCDHQQMQSTGQFSCTCPTCTKNFNVPYCSQSPDHHCKLGGPEKDECVYCKQVPGRLTFDTIDSLFAADYSRLHGTNYKEFYKVWQRFFPYGCGVYQPGGYWPDTNQCAPKIMFSQKKPLESQAEVVKSIIPFIKPVVDRHSFPVGAKVLEIFEYTCPEVGHFVLLELDKTWHVQNTRWSFNRDLKVASLDECLKFIYDRHPYERMEEYED